MDLKLRSYRSGDLQADGYHIETYRVAKGDLASYKRSELRHLFGPYLEQCRRLLSCISVFKEQARGYLNVCRRRYV